MTAPTQTTSTGWFYADAETEPNSKGWDGRLWPEIVGYRGQESPMLESRRRVAAPTAELPPIFEIVTLPDTQPETPVLAAVEPKTSVLAAVEPKTSVLAAVEPKTSVLAAVEPETSVLAAVEPKSGRGNSQNREEAVETQVQSALMGHVFIVLALILLVVAITLGVLL